MTDSSFSGDKNYFSEVLLVFLLLLISQDWVFYTYTNNRKAGKWALDEIMLYYTVAVIGLDNDDFCPGLGTLHEHLLVRGEEWLLGRHLTLI